MFLTSNYYLDCWLDQLVLYAAVADPNEELVPW